MFRAFLTILISAISLISLGQEINPQVSFQKDTIQIGESVPFSVWITYPKDLDVVFPDSLYDFSPFEIDRKLYYPTKSDSLLSSDSVVYFLSTFEIDSVQKLSLPLFIINEYDSTRIETATDSIILEHLVTEIPDSVALKINTDFTKVPLEFNYPYVIIGVSAGLIVILIVFIVFGKTFKRQIALFRLRRRHKKFLQKFAAQLDKPSIEAESSLVVWKKYMERLTKKPFTKMTSKEIDDLTGDTNLHQWLRTIDRAIYGKGDSEQLKPALEGLQVKAVEAFEKRSEEIKNG